MGWAKEILAGGLWCLSGVFPRVLMNPGGLRSWSRTVTLSELENPQTVAMRKNEFVDVQIPLDRLLVKNISIPHAAQKNLEKIVALQIAQSMPNNGEDLVWRYENVARSSESIQLAVYLAKKDQLSKIAQEVTKLGGAIRTVLVGGKLSLKPFLDARKKRDRPAFFWGGIAVVLSVSIVTISVFDWVRDFRALETQTVELRRQFNEQVVALQRAENVRANKDGEIAETRAKIDALVADQQVLTQLVELTMVLPDDVWVSDLSLNDGVLRISGFSNGDVPTVLDAMRSLPWAKEVSLNGQIAYDSYRQQNRFDARVTLVSQGEAREL